MRNVIIRFLRYVLIFVFALYFVKPALAHGDEPRLEISVERVNPGGVVEVRGVGFDYEESVSLSLVRSKIQVPLNDVAADVEGIFTQIIVLPIDLHAGEYKFRAKSDHHTVLSPTITVWGSPEEPESDMIEDQSDVQFGPVPTFAPGVVSTPLPRKTTLENLAPKQNVLPSIYLILSVIGLLGLLGLGILKKR